MQAWWILPNRDQRDDILASDGNTILPLRRILDPKLRPAGFSHGVPAELLEKYGPQGVQQILFAQKFSGWIGNRDLFCMSAPAGEDSSGRTVHLGLLFMLEPIEHPQFDLPYGALSEEDQAFAKTLLHRMKSPERRDLWARSVRELAELPFRGGPATNVALERSAVRFDSLYAAGPNGPIRKSGILRRQSTVAFVLLILFATAGAWLYERGCEHSTRHAVQTGVSTWHLS